MVGAIRKDTKMDKWLALGQFDQAVIAAGWAERDGSWAHAQTQWDEAFVQLSGCQQACAERGISDADIDDAMTSLLTMKLEA